MTLACYWLWKCVDRKLLHCSLLSNWGQNWEQRPGGRFLKSRKANSILIDLGFLKRPLHHFVVGRCCKLKSLRAPTIKEHDVHNNLEDFKASIFGAFCIERSMFVFLRCPLQTAKLLELPDFSSVWGVGDIFQMGFMYFRCRRHWAKFQRTLTVVSKHASTEASIGFKDHWHWKSDCFILALFDAKVSVCIAKMKTIHSVLQCRQSLQGLLTPSNFLSVHQLLSSLKEGNKNK